MSTFRRGYKSWCEATSIQYRTVLGLDPAAPMPVLKLAKHLGVRVLKVEDVPDVAPAALLQLTKHDPESWSAVMITHRNVNVVVMNSTHSPGRQSSSLAHECSHIILNHKPLQVLKSPGGILVSSYDRQQEDEADWLAGALLLPRVALLKIVNSRANHAGSARLYAVSDDMLRMRLERTGVTIQMRRKAG